ncbi:MAG TPA: glutamyl-tRNA reductase [Candidatus Methanoperedens sp.]|nr:glutamyl-tRNA reductase [Candidatus Methanoperedens sp.]
MDIIVLGLNHKTAPVHIRERVAFPEKSIHEPLRALHGAPGVRETMILSTCNRVEIAAVVDGREQGAAAVRAFVARHHEVPEGELAPHLYLHAGADAVRHLFRVASSLDSLVVGEPQILGQVKDAYQYAREAGAVGAVLDRLLKKALSVAKLVRTETEISRSAVSVSFAAVELAKKIFGEIEGRTAMIVGAGEMAELAVKHLVSSGVREVFVVNRTFEKAVELAQEFGGSAVKFDDLCERMALADIVISSTGAPHFIIRGEDVKRVMVRRKHRPMFFIDIAVPRDIEPSVNDVDNAYLYNVDDLQSVVDANVKERRKEAEKAEAIVDQEVGTFEKWIASLQVVPTIVQLRQQVDAVRAAELEKSLGRLGHLSEKDREQVALLTQSIVNKILHSPLTVLKESSQTPEAGTYLEVARKLFNITEPPAGQGGTNGHGTN